MLRIITTESSRWTLNEDAMIMTRIPLSEAPLSKGVPYQQVGKPERFLWAHTVNDPFVRVCVHLDRPNTVEAFQEMGVHKRYATGMIVSDTHPNTEIGTPEPCP